MTRKEKWKELNPGKKFSSNFHCPYRDMGIESRLCYHEEITCEECWNKEYDEREVAKQCRMKLIDIVIAVRMILWLEFVFACGCILLSEFLPFEVCFYLLFGLITALNGIGALCIELKMKKENKNARNNKMER